MPKEIATIPKNNALAVAANTDTTDVRGKENITKEDVTLPQIKICQNNSPQKDSDSADFIEGLKEGDLFNSITGEVYGRGPVLFAIIRLDKRAIEFDEDRNVVDLNVPWNDPRCEFSDGPDGSRTKPVATRFYDYVIFLPESFGAAVLSMSNSKVKVAKKLNSILAMRPGAAWAGLFKLASVKEERNGDKYFNFKIDPAGPSSDDVALYAAQMYDRFATVTVNVDGGTDDEVANPDEF